MLRTKWFRMVAFLVCCTPIFIWAAIFLSYDNDPHAHDQCAKKFDTIIVLGTPAKSDGTPSPEQRERTLEGVREYKAGVAPYIIMTGGAAHNKFVEGQVMVDYAAAQGVPRDVMIVEGRATDTVTNIWYSKIIMDQHGWKTAEVISSPYHLPRTSLILEHYQFGWTRA